MVDILYKNAKHKSDYNKHKTITIPADKQPHKSMTGLKLEARVKCSYILFMVV